MAAATTLTAIAHGSALLPCSVWSSTRSVSSTCRSGHPAVALQSCGKGYGTGNVAVDALRDVDVEVWPGEFVVILGANDRSEPTAS
jgi:putative ABC transport system ATP-binding protein